MDDRNQAWRDLNISIAHFSAHLDERRAKLAHAASIRGPLGTQFIRRVRDDATAENTLNDAKNAVGGRPVDVHFESRWLFWGFALVIGIAEIVANKQLFDMVFLGSAAASVLVAIVLSGILLGLAHHAGFFVRQMYLESMGRILWDRTLLGIGLILVVVVIILSLMVTRAHFANPDVFSSSSALFGQLAESIEKKGIWTLILESFEVTESLSLGGFNFICVVMAFLLGFLSHDNDRDYDKCYSIHKKMRTRLNKVQNKYEKHAQAVFRSHEKRINIARQAYRSAHANLSNEALQQGNIPELPEDDFAADRKFAETERGNNLIQEKIFANSNDPQKTGTVSVEPVNVQDAPVSKLEPESSGHKQGWGSWRS